MTTTTPTQSAHHLFGIYWYSQELGLPVDPHLPDQILDEKAAEEGVTLTPGQRAVCLERLAARWLLDDIWAQLPDLTPPAGPYRP